ncbi:MAG: glycosyltransferase family 4 protein [Anaerolineae bacterium]|nr:glycosyltransferase family 4 protein [Anaerolineae bacterium]
MQGLKYVSLADETGYGVAARCYIQGLHAAGVPLTWAPMTPGLGLGLGYEPSDRRNLGAPPLNQVCNRALSYDRVLVHTVPEYFPYWLDREGGQGRKLWGYVAWETDRLPRHWPDVLNQMDGLFVPSEWLRTVFQQGGVTRPLVALPHLSQFAGQPPPEASLVRLRRRLGLGRTPTPFVFTTIGQWTPRKGVDLVLEAYWRAFSATDPVLLVVKTSRHDLTRPQRRSWRSLFRNAHPTVDEAIYRLQQPYRNRAPLALVTEVLPADEMQALLALSDAYISLSRAEGWGLGAYEAAWFGKPVIATAHPGYQAYLPAEAAWWVDAQAAPVSEVQGWESYSSEQTWYEPDVDRAAALMRTVVENRSMALERGQALRAHVARVFAAEPIVQRMITALAA